MAIIRDDGDERRTRIDALSNKLRRQTDIFHEHMRVSASDVVKRIGAQADAAEQPAPTKQTPNRLT